MVAVATDPESTLLATQFATIFRRAGWQVQTQSRTYNALVLGILVPEPSETAQAIRTALTNAGIAFGTAEPGGGGFVGMGGNLRGSIPPATLIVGSKPPPF